jgi:hypothetical protein
VTPGDGGFDVGRLVVVEVDPEVVGAWVGVVNGIVVTTVVGVEAAGGGLAAREAGRTLVRLAWTGWLCRSAPRSARL